MAGNISSDKTRFSVSLRTKQAKEFKALAKALRLPHSFMSAYIDHCVIALLPTLQAIKTMKDQGGDQVTDAEILAAIFKGVADSEKDDKLQMELFGD